MDASFIFAVGFLGLWIAAMTAINRLGLMSLAYRDRYTLASYVSHLADRR